MFADKNKLECFGVCTSWKLLVRDISNQYASKALLVSTKCASCQTVTGPFTAGKAIVTLNSTMDGRQAACPGEVVTYTCTVLRTSAAGWHVPPDIMELNYFPSSPIGQQVIGNFQLALTSSIVDPNNPGLANITITVTVIATAEQNGTVVECRGDDPSERMSLVMKIASEHSVYACIISKT